MKNNIGEEIKVKLLFSDIIGREKSVYISLTDLKTALSFGIKVDGSDVIGLTGICESEFILKPKESSKRIHRNENCQMQIIYNCKVTTMDGIDVDELADDLMKNAMEEAKILGFSDFDKSQLIEMLFPTSNPVVLQIAS